MAKRSLGQNTRCSYNEKRNAGFYFFKSHLNKGKTLVSNPNIGLVIIRDVVNDI